MPRSLFAPLIRGASFLREEFVESDSGGEAAASVLLSIIVAPDTASVNAGTTQQFTATGHYNNKPDQDITATVTWDTSDHAKATINSAGLLSGVAEGTCTVSATAGIVTDSSGTITINKVLTSITVTPTNPALDAATQQMVATAHYTGASDADVTATVTWASATPTVATISAGGLVTPVIAGTSVVSATSGIIVGNTTVTVNSVTFSLPGAGTAAAATTIAIPTHAAGDLIVICARRASNTPATVPGESGTIPSFQTIQTGGADTLSIVTAVALANAANHTSGTWTNAAQLAVFVFRGNRPIVPGASSSASGGVASTDVVYPALTRQSTAGPAIARFMSRANTAGDAAMLTPPSGYTLGAGISTAPAPVIVSHDRLSSSSNPTADTQAMTNNSFAYRGHSVELREAPAKPIITGVGTPSTGTGAITPVAPTHVANDVQIMFVEADTDGTTTLTTANGFAEGADSPQATGVTPNGTRLSWFWRRATGAAMADPVVADAGDHVSAVIINVRGCIATGNPWDVTSGNTGTSSTTVTIPGDTTTVDGCLVLAACSIVTDTITPQFSIWVNNDLFDFREMSDHATTDGNGGGIGIAAGVMVKAGVYGNSVATLGNASVQGRVSIALKPA